MVWFSFYGKAGRAEEFHKGLCLIRDGFNLSLVGSLFWIWASSLDYSLKFDEKEVSTSGLASVSGRFLLALLQTCVCLGNFVWTAAVREKDDPDSWRANSLGFGKSPFGVGHLSFFTTQSLFFILIFQWFSFLAGWSRDGHLAAAVNNLALWNAGHSLLLTLLFLKLNYFEEGWVKLYKMKEIKTPHAIQLMLFTHTGNLVVTTLDFFFVQTKYAVVHLGPTLPDLLGAIFLYAFGYSFFIFWLSDSRGIDVYPFVSKVKSIQMRFGFAFAVSIAVVVGYGFMFVMKSNLM